ncbi:BREX-1 system adenine-specific DNA-methyltransferase PglX [Balneolales bacterium ANBcel1]|nr:BREX-1 system adenine-specific DNA-methyltransferase PglX [Balneolales bacterium ANBcel1]
MNTARLKRFAQETRRKLLKQVSAKMEHVLSADNGAMRDKAHVVAELKKDLKRLGRDTLIDKVAYTWFNRFAALRYMDVRGFQPLEIAMLTPQPGQVNAQILQEAMAGHIPSDLPVDRSKVMDLLDGRVSSKNPENEAYRLLLVAACNHLHSILPFLFEKIDDYSELLLPDDLTSQFSVVHDMVKGMSGEDCGQVEILGWLYQFYISEKKDEVFASKGKVSKEEIPAATQLFTPRWIVEYMVQNTVGKLWVMNHPDSRLRDHMPYYIENAELSPEDVLRIDRPEELTLLDQACGSGHILVYGFELLYLIYEEQGYSPAEIPPLIIRHNLYGFEIDERAAQLAGLTVLMKAREYQRRLFRRSEVPVPNITCFEDLPLSEIEIRETLKVAGVSATDELLHDLDLMTQATNFGSLINPKTKSVFFINTLDVCSKYLKSADLFAYKKVTSLINALKSLKSLADKYTSVVANPPYMGSGKMNEELSVWIEENYPQSKADLYCCFIERSMAFALSNGFTGLVTMESWMFKTSYSDFRASFLQKYRIDSLSHFGWHIMRISFGTVAFISNNSLPNEKSRGFYSYLRTENINKKNERPIRFPVIDKKSKWLSQYKFFDLPNSIVGYWLSDSVYNVFKIADPLSNIYKPKKGITTSNDEQFIRIWFESSLKDLNLNAKANDNNGKWFPVTKGGNHRKWFGNIINTILWENNGYKLKNFKFDNGKSRSVLRNQYYNFKKGITWNDVSAGNFSCRLVPEGTLMLAVGPIIFNVDDIDYAIALLNSKTSQFIFSILAPGNKFEVGIVSRFPLLKDSNELIDLLSVQSVKISQSEWDSRETSWDFQQNELIRVRGNDPIDLEEAWDLYQEYWKKKFFQLHRNEEELNRQFIEIYGLQDELTPDVPLDEITILQDETKIRNNDLVFKPKEVFAQFISYGVGCLFGRYTLDQPGLILANQGETLEDYFNKVSHSREQLRLIPDKDNLIPVLDDEWFEDDIVARFHEFLKASFGTENFRRNLAFLEDQIGKDLRKYFARDFYPDHIKRYKKRPIYWKFSSPKKYFSVLIYMHRYTPDTLNNILNNYLREFIEKLKTRRESMKHLEANGSPGEKTKALKEIDKLNEMIQDCEHYEREILYALASERIEIDLDDGVLVNYNKFGEAIEQVAGLNDSKAKKKVKGFDWIDATAIR